MKYEILNKLGEMHKLYTDLQFERNLALKNHRLVIEVMPLSCQNGGSFNEAKKNGFLKNEERFLVTVVSHRFKV
ncbi:hypothetical protein ACFQZI_04770 [Mucilaginibacter lutimaris]|uniref:Uncharacterized protein n=1 Tax=Mucilaginibacter lutimaris TaxID=931629 RepID=A0ABW2ZD99_9SPHI